MSLAFGGYNVRVHVYPGALTKVGTPAEVSISGYSTPDEDGVECSVAKAIEAATQTPEFKEVCKKLEEHAHSLHFTMPLTVTVDVITKMP